MAVLSVPKIPSVEDLSSRMCRRYPSRVSCPLIEDESQTLNISTVQHFCACFSVALEHKKRDLKAVLRQPRLWFVLQVKEYLCAIFHCRCAQRPYCSTIRSTTLLNYRISVSSSTSFAHRHSDRHGHRDSDTCCLHNISGEDVMSFFYVLLTAHLSICLVNDQLDTQFFYFIIRLLQSSTCFEQRRAHHQEVKFY